MIPVDQKTTTTAIPAERTASIISMDDMTMNRSMEMKISNSGSGDANNDDDINNNDQMLIDQSSSKEALHLQQHVTTSDDINSDNSITHSEEAENNQKKPEMRDPLADALERLVLFLDDTRESAVSTLSTTPATAAAPESINDNTTPVSSTTAITDSIQQLGDYMWCQDTAMFEVAVNYLNDGICEGKNSSSNSNVNTNSVTTTPEVRLAPIWLSSSEDENVQEVFQQKKNNKEKNQYIHRGGKINRHGSCGSAFVRMNHSSSILSTTSSKSILGLHLSPAFSEGGEDDVGGGGVSLDRCNSFDDDEDVLE